MAWTQTLEAGVRSIASEIAGQEGVRSLCRGSLPRERFALFLRQDSIYLSSYRGSILFLAHRAGGAAGQELRRMAYGSVGIEMRTQARLDALFGWRSLPERVLPATGRYIAYERAACLQMPLCMGLASLLPCFWLYHEVVSLIALRAARPNPFSAWTDTYADPSFEADILAYRAICDAAAASLSSEEREAMTRLFLAGCGHEGGMFGLLD